MSKIASAQVVEIFWILPILKSDIDFTTHKASLRLQQLKQIVYSKQWQWKPYSIWKLYQSLILPVLLQNIIIYSPTASNIRSITQLHQQAQRLALDATPKASLLKLQKLLNTKTIPHWYDIKLVQFHLKCQLAPPNTFAGRCWLQYYITLQQPMPYPHRSGSHIM